MKTMSFSFNINQFNQLFPFFIVIDSDSTIADYGKSLQEIFPTANNQLFTKHFVLKVPEIQEINFNTLSALANQECVIESVQDPKITFKGSIELLHNTNQLVFLIFPLPTSYNNIEALDFNNATYTGYNSFITDLVQSFKIQEILNTDIKQLHTTLNNQRSELKRLSLVVEETINGVVITDANIRIQWINKSFEKITGYTAEEVIGKNPGSILQGTNTDPKTVLYLKERIHKKLPFECEILNYSKQGNPYWIKLTGQPIFDELGNVTQFFALEEDITQRKLSEEKLMLAEERWQFALEGTGDGVWEYNFQTGEVYYSPAYKAMLGYEDDEFKNEIYEWTTRLHVDDLNIIEETDKLYEDGKINSHAREYRLKTKSGEYIWVLDRGMVISRTPNGQPLRMIGTHTNITERKLTAIALEQSEKQYRSLSENIPGVVYVYEFRPDGTHGATFVSATIEKIFGISATDFMQTAAQLVHPYDQKQLLEKINHSFITNESFSYEGRIITPNKGIMWHAANSSFSYEKQDGTRVFTGIITDITEKKLAEKKLEDQRKFYENILNEIPADIAVFDKDRTYLFVNPVAIKNPELRKWIIGKKDEDYFRERNKPLEILNERKRIFNEVIAAKSLKSWEEKLITSEGNTEYHLRNMYPVLDEKGEIKNIIGYGIIITKQKEIEQQLLLNEKRYRDLFNYSQALICTHDLSGKILSVNPAICEALQYSSEELIGKKIQDFIPEKDKQKFQPEYLDRIANAEKINGLFRVVSKTGKIIFLLYQNYKAQEPNTEPYVIGFSQDITDRIKAEQELLLAKKITEEASKAKEIFLANMSHEIRTPMTGILGLASLLSKTNLNDQQKNYIQLITESANNLLTIVNDVLDIEKIASGKFEFEKVHFRISDKVSTTIQSFQYKAEEKGLQLIFDDKLPTDLVIIGDPYRLSQILNNLLSNALKFTERGKIIVSSNIVENNNNKVGIQFSVSDTGIGISKEKSISIFDPFIQASTDVARKYGGTGLGLSICKNLVEMQGGKILLESEAGKGSTFLFKLMYEIGTASLLKEDNKAEVSFKSIGKKTILIAEDVELNQYLAKHILESWQFSTDIANNGKEAVEKVKQNNYDLILMDIQMPEMDGIAATKAIRKLTDATKANIPIIALTAHALKGDDQLYIAAGMNDYVTKPYTEEKLYKTISKYLQSNIKEVSDNKTESSNSSEVSDKLYNLSMVNVIGRNNPEFAAKMVKLFLDNIPIELQKLTTAVKENDIKTVNFIAHKMKSTIDSMGIEKIRTSIRALEMKEEIIIDESVIELHLEKITTVLHKAIEQMKADFSIGN